MDDSIKIRELDEEVNDETVSLKQLRQFKKDVLDKAINTIQNLKERISSLEQQAIDIKRENLLLKGKVTQLSAQIKTLEDKSP